MQFSCHFKAFYLSQFLRPRPSARPASGSPWWQLWWPWAAESRYLEGTWTTWRSTAAVSHTACWGCWAGDGEHRAGCCHNQSTQPLVRCFPGYWWSAGRAARHGCLVCKTWRPRSDCRWTLPSGTGTSRMGPNPRLSRPQNASASCLWHEYKDWLDFMPITHHRASVFVFLCQVNSNFEWQNSCIWNSSSTPLLAKDPV